MATVSEMVKKEIGVKSLSEKGKPETIMGNISFEKIKEIAKAKENEIPGNTFEAKVRQVVGSCRSYRITIDGKSPKEFAHWDGK
jgi:ribosomal protein L11